MRVRERGSWISRTLTLAAVAVLSPALFAQTSGQQARTPLDITGTWQQVVEKTMFRWTALDQDPPLQPWALEMYRKAREGKRLDERGDGWLDPETYCLPWGTPRLWTSTVPIIIVEAPGKVIIIHASETSPLPRIVYTDGRDHPEGYPARFDGHSIGRWDHGTFVIDTVALDPDTWIDDSGTPHSEALHTVERLRRVNLTTLEVSVEFNDPKAFTRPWTGIKKTFKMYPDWEYIPGIACEDRFHADFQKKTPRSAEDRVVVPR
jgi:hypothetical protein